VVEQNSGNFATGALGPGAQSADALKLYGRLILLSIRSHLEYRLSFFLMVIGHFVTSVVEAVGLWALFDRFGMLGQWSLAQVAFLYGIVNVAFPISEALARGFDIFGRDFVKTGNFDRLLLRPRSTVLQLAGHDFQLQRLGRLLQGLIVLIWAIWMLDVAWHPGTVFLLLFTIVSGVVFFYALFIFQATLSFWATESLEVMNTLTYGGVETAQYPLAIYQPGFRRFFTFVIPLGCISYFPAVAILGIDDPLGSPVALQWLAPFAGYLFFAVSLAVWHLGIRHYTSTGS